MRRSRTATARLKACRLQRAHVREGCAWRPRTTWSSFLLQRSCLASALTRRPVNAYGLWVFAVPWSLVAAPPFPASSAFAAAAKPQSAMAAIPRGSAGGGRHSPDRVNGHHRRGVKRTAFRSRPRAESGTSTTSTAADDDHDASASGRARRGYQRCAATWGLLGTGAAVLRPSAHRRAGVERAEPIARQSRARLTGSCSCLMQCLADELDLLAGFA
jgi:hypothetical protein